MPIEFPPLLDLGGEEEFAAYQEAFNRLYRSGEVKDVWDRRILFDAERWVHVCYKDPPGSKHGTLPRGWAQARAARIPWILMALQTPDSIHPSHTHAGRQAYLVEGNLSSPSGSVWQRFMVYVEPETARRPKRADFITAFPPDTLGYWKAAKNEAPRLYPPKVHRGKKRR